MHSLEEHTTTREELIGKVKTNADEHEESSNGSNESDIKSWSLDHSYLSQIEMAKNSKASKTKGRLVKSKKLDYR